MGSIETSEFRRRRKMNLIKVCGGQCCICGYHKSISALEFHHIYPELKEYAISATGTCHNIEKDLTEVQKCVLVCANCHREIHDGIYSAVQLEALRIFNDDIAKQLIEETQTKYMAKPRLCSVCGAPITADSKSGKCSVCVRKSTIKPDRETLKTLVFYNSFVAIGKQYGVSDKAVTKWCLSYNLPHLRSEIKKYSYEQWNQL